MDLGEMRARVRVDLHDENTNEERWTDATLDRHIARALRELSLAAPRELVATVSTTAGSRELDIVTLTDRVAVDAVEYPTDEHPPLFAPFSVWGDTLTSRSSAGRAASRMCASATRRCTSSTP